ncbi:MAG: hypothetical protein AMS16_02685 [Planctomycetes bacterium DG_58]|nr:MAG: hypothetical protein AMS16_02685 [Planctomycetes bacterium DG_58]
MRQFVYENLDHVLCVLVLISRLGDVVSTRLATPKLKLEANPIAKKLGWWFIAATLGLCVVPYFHRGAAVVVLTVSCLVSASNISKLWAIRALGEEGYHRHMMRMARKAKPLHAMGGYVAASLFVALLGATQILLSPGPSRDWGYWFGLGILTYAFAMLIYGPIAYRRFFRQAKKLLAETPEGELET